MQFSADICFQVILIEDRDDIESGSFVQFDTIVSVSISVVLLR